MDNLRRIANAVRLSTDPSEREIGRQIVRQFDDYLADIPASDVIAGNAEEGAAALRSGGDLSKRFRKSQMIETAETTAEHRAGATGSGGNLENAMRQNIRAILDNPKKAAAFSPAEREAMERVVMGSRTQNALRQVGKLSPEGSGLMAALGIGATAFHPPLGLAPIAGMPAKPVATRMAVNNIEQLGDLVRSGNDVPLPELLPSMQRDLLEVMLRSLAQGSGAQQP